MESQVTLGLRAAAQEGSSHTTDPATSGTGQGPRAGQAGPSAIHHNCLEQE